MMVFKLTAPLGFAEYAAPDIYQDGDKHEKCACVPAARRDKPRFPPNSDERRINSPVRLGSTAPCQCCLQERSFCVLTVEDKAMKKLLATALILSMLGASAAVAAPYGTVNRAPHAQDNSGAIVAGIGLLMLGAFLASQNNQREYVAQRTYQDHGWNQDRDNGWNGGRNQNWNNNRNDRGGYDNRSHDYRGH
jgi:hypothetical protein